MSEDHDRDAVRKQFLSTRMMWIIALIGIAFPAVIILGGAIAARFGLLPDSFTNWFLMQWFFLGSP